MRDIKWLNILIALLLIVSCFFPWVIIESKNIVISGVSAEGTRYGKPGYLNIFLTGIVFILSFIPRLWAQRICLFVAAFNLGWTLRNFILLSACEAGECPQRQPAFFVLLISSILLLVAVIFQKIKVLDQKENAS